MEFISENIFLKTLAKAGIKPRDDGKSLCYEKDARVLGFDFTNLTVPDQPMVPADLADSTDRNVEYAMVLTILKAVELLDIFPLYLYSVDDRWADEDFGALSKRGLLTREEAEALGAIAEKRRQMDAVKVEREDLPAAARLICPQFTVFQTSVIMTDGEGKILVSFSPDDEVSFNTQDERIYEKTSAMIKSLGGLPFEIIWA